MQLETHLSEFGFRGDTPVAANSAFFDLAVGLVTYAQDGCCPQLVRSEVGLRSDQGALTLFYGDSPLARSNKFFILMVWEFYKRCSPLCCVTRNVTLQVDLVKLILERPFSFLKVKQFE